MRRHIIICSYKTHPAFFHDQRWPLNIKLKLSAFLLSTLIDTATVDAVVTDRETGKKSTQCQPAFSHIVKFRRSRRDGILAPNPALIKKMMREPRGHFLARHLPMVVPPSLFWAMLAVSLAIGAFSTIIAVVKVLRVDPAAVLMR